MNFNLVFKDKAKASQFIAKFLSKLCFLCDGSVMLGTATGSTFNEVYSELKKCRVPDNVKFIRQLDNYYSGPVNKLRNEELPDYSYEKEIRNALCRFLPASEFDIPNEFALSPLEEAIRYSSSRKYASQHSKLKIQLLGIGRDGHIAFNEPGSDFWSGTHVVDLDPITIEDNSRFFGGDESKVPKRAITTGLGEIMGQTDVMIFAAFGQGKQDIATEALYGVVRREIPASALQLFDGVCVRVFDKEAAPEFGINELCCLSAEELAKKVFKTLAL